MTRTPTFLIAGAARSGTTSLVEGLRSHPQVFITEPKEPHYLALHGKPAEFTGPGDPATINRVAVTEHDAYQRLFPSDGFTAYGDGSVSTLYYAERAFPEALRLNPDVRAVVLLREPVERAFSSYQYLQARGFEDTPTFAEAVSKEPARIAAGWHHLWHYTSMSHYASSLQTALDHLGEDRLRVWFYDDLERDYAGTLAAVMRFIGVDENATHVTSMDRVNSSGAPRNAWISGLLKSATGNETIRSGVKAVTTYRFRERVRRMVLRRSTATPEVVAEMRGLFDEDRARLRAMLPALVGSPLPEWLASQGELR